MVHSLAAHVQGSQPLEPKMEKLVKAFVKARKRMLMQRNFSEFGASSPTISARCPSMHDWCPEAGAGLVGPDERMLYYMAHGTLLTEVGGLGRASKEVTR
jgi:hypothetical protein